MTFQNLDAENGRSAKACAAVLDIAFSTHCLRFLADLCMRRMPVAHGQLFVAQCLSTIRFEADLDDRVLSSPESRMARLTKITTITRCLYGNLRIETCLRLLGAVLAAYLFSKVRLTDFGVPMSAQHLQEQLTLGRECDRMCMSNACRALILLHAMFT
jgi:hypothetical protein